MKSFIKQSLLFYKPLFLIDNGELQLKTVGLINLQVYFFGSLVGPRETNMSNLQIAFFFCGDNQSNRDKCRDTRRTKECPKRKTDQFPSIQRQKTVRTNTHTGKNIF